jgi:hypothetical protein
MRRILQITAVILVWFLASAPGCNEQQDAAKRREEQRQQALKDSLVSAFSSDSLSPESLRSFELTAIGKVSDLRDYLEIYSSPSRDTAFRNKAGTMIRSLFLSGRIPGPLTDSSFHFSASKVNVAAPLLQENDTLCRGVLAFERGTLDIYAVRREKIFGADTLRVWEVKLGEFR